MRIDHLLLVESFVVALKGFERSKLKAQTEDEVLNPTQYREKLNHEQAHLNISHPRQKGPACNHASTIVYCDESIESRFEK